MLWHHWCLYIIWKKPIHNCGRNFCNPEVQVELQHMNVCMRQKTCKLEQMRTLGSGSLPSVHLIWVLWAISPKPWAVSASESKIVGWRHKSDDQHCDLCQIHAESCTWKITVTWSSTEPCLSPETKQTPQPSWLQKIPKDQTDQPCDSLHPRCKCYHMKRESHSDLLH